MPEFEPHPPPVGDPHPGGGFNPPPGYPGGAIQQAPTAQMQMQMPQRGVFAMSETLPIIQNHLAAMNTARDEWLRLRVAANEAKAHAKQTRANLIVRLRVFGNDGTGGIPIKTSAERNEWADADPGVQQAELDADLAQTVQMAAREAYDDAQAAFDTLRSMLGMERDDLARGANDYR